MKREAFNYDSFLWSITTVFARQNKILVPGAGGKQVEALALIPCFDLINHEVCRCFSKAFLFLKIFLTFLRVLAN